MRMVICYDVEETRRRTRIRRVLKAYGVSVQESVYEADVDQAQQKALQQKVRALLGGKDRVRFYMLCKGCEQRIAGTPELAGAVSPQTLIV